MVPSKFTQGDAVSFAITSFKDVNGRLISSPDWNFSIYIRGNNNAFTGTASGMKFSFSSQETKELKPGLSFFQIVAEKSEEKITVEQGQIQIDASFVDQTSDFDPRSKTRIDLDTVQNLIRKIISSGGVIEYKIGTRSAKKYELSDLISLESKLKWQLANEEKAARIKDGRGNPNSLLVSFK